MVSSIYIHFVGMKGITTWGNIYINILKLYQGKKNLLKNDLLLTSIKENNLIISRVNEYLTIF